MHTLIIDGSSGAAGDMFLASLYQVLEGKFSLGDQALGKLQKLGEFLGLQAVTFQKKTALDVNGYRLDFSASSELSSHLHAKDVLPMLEKMLAAEVINQSTMVYAISIFDIITEAEAEAHKVVPEKVHFHEVGREDSILDIVGFSLLWDFILGKIGDVKVVSSPIELGLGTVMTSHGELEIPAPATRNIINAKGFSTNATREGECLTPTGAAILGFLKPMFSDFDQIDKDTSGIKGVGFGAREPKSFVNALCLVLQEQ